MEKTSCAMLPAARSDTWVKKRKISPCVARPQVPAQVAPHLCYLNLRANFNNESEPNTFYINLSVKISLIK